MGTRIRRIDIEKTVQIDLSDGSGCLVANPTENGRIQLRIEPREGFFGAPCEWATKYPIDLIREIANIKGAWTCDEIMRDENPSYVENSLKNDVFSYLDEASFEKSTILDFGCGSGASTMILHRLLPSCSITGVELDERLLQIAKLRADYYCTDNVTLLHSPNSISLPEELGKFDFVMLSAVYEHMLPDERKSLVPQLWGCLKRGGILFVNQTPHRWSPYENHTTKLPFINYLPDKATHVAACMLSRHVSRDATWETLLRDGIRGASVKEILGILRLSGEAELLRPRPEIGDRIDLWYRSLSTQHRLFKRTIWAALKSFKVATRLEIVPSLALAIRKC